MSHVGCYSRGAGGWDDVQEVGNANTFFHGVCVVTRGVEMQGVWHVGPPHCLFVPCDFRRINFPLHHSPRMQHAPRGAVAGHPSLGAIRRLPVGCQSAMAGARLHAFTFYMLRADVFLLVLRVIRFDR